MAVTDKSIHLPSQQYIRLMIEGDVSCCCEIEHLIPYAEHLLTKCIQSIIGEDFEKEDRPKEGNNRKLENVSKLSFSHHWSPFLVVPSRVRRLDSRVGSNLNSKAAVRSVRRLRVFLCLLHSFIQSAVVTPDSATLAVTVALSFAATLRTKLAIEVFPAKA